MLCDDLVSDPVLPLLYDGIDKVLAKIKQAQKFVLSRDFAMAADGLVENIPELQKAAPWCRVPYPLTWMEWLHDDRPHWDESGPHKARPIDPSRHQHRPHRIGLLMEQHDRASYWKSQLFWSMRGADANVPTPYNSSLGAHWFDAEKCTGARDPLVAAVRPDMADFGHKMVADLMKTAPDIVKRLGQYAIEDWGGEIRFMVATLGLLNARNVAETTKVNNDTMNAKRKRYGKRELFSHHVLKVRPSVVVWRNSRDSAEGHRDLRMHFVRGHFKTRASGIFWWSMHTRGKLQHGTVTKDYEVDV